MTKISYLYIVPLICYSLLENVTFLTNVTKTLRKNGQNFFSSLTFISMTHVAIMILRCIVNETQTDRQTDNANL